MADESRPVLFVQWWPSDSINDTYELPPMTDLAYRILIDLVLKTNDNLIDNDEGLAFATKTGKQWKSIKFSLIEEYRKIKVGDGYIRIPHCTEKLEDSLINIQQKSAAGKASAEKRKSLKNKETGSTAVHTDVGTSVSTSHQPSIINEVKNFQHPSPTAAREAGEVLPASGGYRVMDWLSPDDLVDAKAAAPGWDLNKLAEVFDSGIADGSRPMPHKPRKPASYFTGFCRTYTKGKRP